jgi:hypothetical protein
LLDFSEHDSLTQISLESTLHPGDEVVNDAIEVFDGGVSDSGAHFRFQ